MVYDYADSLVKIKDTGRASDHGVLFLKPLSPNISCAVVLQRKKSERVRFNSGFTRYLLLPGMRHFVLSRIQINALRLNPIAVRAREPMDSAKKRKAQAAGEEPNSKAGRNHLETATPLSLELREAHLPSVLTLLVIAETHALLSSRVFSDIDPKGYAAGVASGAEKEFETENQHVVLFVLPNASSRHNSSSKAYAVNAFMKGKKKLLNSSKSIGILVLASSKYHAYAQVAEISRHFPYFSMKSSERARGSVHVIVDFPDMHQDFLLTQHVMDGIRLCQYLVDSPPNILNVNRYVEECQQVAARTAANIEVIRGEQLRDQGFGGIWAVGAASVELPAIVVLSHIPAEATAGTKSVCLVGKGIVFDTGGLSVKISGGMVGMKRDMGGSAAILAAFEAIVKSKSCKRPLYAILCIAENSISSMSTRPDDIITMYSKKTVEINNIDAEGRLVLADGCSYAHRHLNPSHIIDMATLTGAQGVSTGKRHGAIYTNCEELEGKAVLSGRVSGDLVHPMPYCPEFFAREFDSECADMTNSVADRTNAQVSCAAQFVGNHIEGFVEEGGRWLHIDMAYPVYSGERATGYGVALLYDLVNSL